MDKVIVSFTSYPARIKTVYLVVDSIMKQTYQVDKIFLWLSVEEFPAREKNLPDNLKRAERGDCFEIKWVEDNLKSHKKYYYVLQNYSDDIVITIDDDIYYERTMIETLLNSYKRHPYAISARNVHEMYAHKKQIAPYRSWGQMSEICEDIESMDLCAIGVGGVLYPPKCSSKEWFEKEKIKGLAEKQDDLWLKFQEVRLNIPVVFVKPHDVDETIEGSQVIALMNSNLKCDNNICLQKLSQEYRKEENINKWMNELQQVENILLNKKSDCIKKLIPFCGQIIYILGASINAESLYLFIKAFVPSIKVNGFLVSSKEDNRDDIDGVPVYEMQDIEEKQRKIVLIGVSEQTKRTMNLGVLETKNTNLVSVDLQAIKQVYWGLKK